MLKALKIISKPIPFLTDRWGVLFSSMFVTIWLGLGYYMVIYLTALANIDESLYEAASLDGAGPVRQFIYVTMPGVRSTMMLIMMLSTIAAFRVFNEIYVLTNGSAGPGGHGYDDVDAYQARRHRYPGPHWLRERHLHRRARHRRRHAHRAADHTKAR